MRKVILLFTVLFLQQYAGYALDSDSIKISKKKWITISSGIESNLLQLAKVSMTGTMIPRYTYFFNSGFDADIKLAEHLKIFSGVYVKNIGLIVKYNDSIKVKHRVYTVGIPLGFKIPMAKKKVMFRAGADLSVAVNYKWKRFVNNTKTKHNEFFSNETSTLFYSVFAGLMVHGVSVSGSYYLNNFFNSLKSENGHLFVIGIGLNLDEQMMKTKQGAKGEQRFKIQI